MRWSKPSCTRPSFIMVMAPKALKSRRTWAGRPACSLSAHPEVGARRSLTEEPTRPDLGMWRENQWGWAVHVECHPPPSEVLTRPLVEMTGRYQKLSEKLRALTHA